jgi:peptidoglycan/xylan/chitin deacetylase (PgdA/CDA1 family)
MTIPGTAKQSAVRCLHAAAYWSGACAAAGLIGAGNGATVLMYHSVAGRDTERWIAPGMRITPAAFERQMRFLKGRRRVVRMSELVEAITAGREPERGTVAITFDDGYLDNRVIAVPILRSLGLPATIYLPTAYLRQGETHWIDRLWTCVQQRSKHDLDLGEGSSLRLDERGGERKAFERARRMIIPSNPERRESLLQRIQDQLRPREKGPRVVMTWDDARQIQRDHGGIEFGAHTRWHLDLTACSRDTARQEVTGSRDEAETELGMAPEHFSFPYGRSSADARAMVAEAGLASAVASGNATLVRAGTDPFWISRVAAPASDTGLRFWTGAGRGVFAGDPG